MLISKSDSKVMAIIILINVAPKKTVYGNYFVTAGGYQRKGFKASGVWDSAAP